MVDPSVLLFYILQERICTILM